MRIKNNKLVVSQRSESRFCHPQGGIPVPNSPAVQPSPNPGRGSRPGMAPFTGKACRIQYPRLRCYPGARATRQVRRRWCARPSALHPRPAVPGRRCWRGSGKQPVELFTGQPSLCQPKVTLRYSWALLRRTTACAWPHGGGSTLGTITALAGSHGEGRRRAGFDWRRRRRFRWHRWFKALAGGLAALLGVGLFAYSSRPNEKQKESQRKPGGVLGENMLD